MSAWIYSIFLSCSFCDEYDETKKIFMFLKYMGKFVLYLRL